MDLIAITSHVPEAIPSSLVPSLVTALGDLGRRAQPVTALPSASRPTPTGELGILVSPLDALLFHRGPAVIRCFFVLPADPLALLALPQVEARVRVARAQGSSFRVHHWILTEQEPSGLVPMFEKACFPIRPDWVLSPSTDGKSWARSAVEMLLGKSAQDMVYRDGSEAPSVSGPSHLESVSPDPGPLKTERRPESKTAVPPPSASVDADSKPRRRRWVAGLLAGLLGVLVVIALLGSEAWRLFRN